MLVAAGQYLACVSYREACVFCVALAAQCEPATLALSKYIAATCSCARGLHHPPSTSQVLLGRY